MHPSMITKTSAFAPVTRRVPRLQLHGVALLSQRSTRVSSRTYASSGPNSTSPEAELKSAKDRAAVGTFDWRAAAIFVATGVGLYFYFEHEKAQVQERKRKEIKERKYGKAFVGGPFSLIEAKSGEPFTQDNLVGQWNLVYFGFTNCPDVCPEELDKMSKVVDDVEKRYGDRIQPIFISCDPARDTDEALRKYLTDFHPRMVGLTGSYDAVKAACKAYRVYFSTPPNTKPGDDYLVDHSIFFYLMDPAGSFVEAFGKSSAAHQVIHTFDEARKDWAERIKRGEV